MGKVKPFKDEEEILATLSQFPIGKGKATRFMSCLLSIVKDIEKVNKNGINAYEFVAENTVKENMERTAYSAITLAFIKLNQNAVFILLFFKNNSVYLTNILISIYVEVYYHKYTTKKYKI